MVITLEALLQSAADGTMGQVVADPANISPELATEARAAFKQATEAGNLSFALVAASAAALTWLHLGNRREALVSYIDWQQLEYMRADSPAEYGAAREGLLTAMTMANDLDDRAEAFKAGQIAADCSFWASESAGGGAAGDQWLIQALRDLIILEPLVDSGERVMYERFVSLLAATANKALSTFWSADSGTVDDLLTELARVADATIPVEFTYQLEGGAEKTANTAAVLARLADEHGG